jgi:hypothetical protein
MAEQPAEPQPHPVHDATTPEELARALPELFAPEPPAPPPPPKLSDEDESESSADETR